MRVSIASSTKRHKYIFGIAALLASLAIAGFGVSWAIRFVQWTFLLPPKTTYSGKDESRRDEAIAALEWMLAADLKETPKQLYIHSSGKLVGSPFDYIGYAKAEVSHLEFNRICRTEEWTVIDEPLIADAAEHAWSGSNQFEAPAWWDANGCSPTGKVYYRESGQAGLEFMKWCDGYLYWFAEITRWSPF